MRNLNFFHKTIIFSVLFILIMLIQEIFMSRISSTIKNDMETNFNVSVPMLNSFHQLQIAVIQTQQWLTDISATRAQDGLDDGFKEAKAAADSFMSAINDLAVLDPDNSEQYRSLIPIFNVYYSAGKKMAESYIADGPKGGNKMMAQFDTAAANINDKVDLLISNFSTEIKKRSEHHIQDANSLEKFTYFFILINLFLLLLLVYGVTKYITKPAQLLIHSLKDIAAGDLTNKLDYDSGDELGQIADQTNNIIKELGHLLSQVTSQGMQISAFSQATNFLIEEAAEVAETQKNRTDNIHEVMNNLTQSVESIYALSAQAQETTIDANNAANNGKNEVIENLNLIKALATDIHNIQVTVTELNDSSIQIGTVLDVIQNIAEQTNLLALNAAIEAARAGEQGRGFAVVADEVRNLAGKTQDSAQEIKVMIDQLQSGSSKAVTLMDESLSQVNSSVEQSERTDKALESIVQFVNKINDMNKQIADSTKTQNNISEVVNEKVDEIIVMNEEVMKQSSIAKKMGIQTRTKATEFSKLVAELKISH